MTAPAFDLDPPNGRPRPRHRLARWWRWLSLRVKRIARHDATPHALALGFAVGAAWSVIPTPGISIVLGILTSLVVPHVHKVSLALAFAMFNPLVCLPINALGFALANQLMGPLKDAVDGVGPWGTSWEVYERTFLGSLPLALALGIASYFLLRRAIAFYQRHAALKRARLSRELP